MATAKSAGSTRLGRDSAAKRLGVKLFEGERAYPGNILIRQRGTRYLAGKNVRMGSDNTLYSVTEGTIKFTQRSKKLFNGSSRSAKVVNVVSA
ncbi:50S ribosomal protein L27 [Candidatus Azambacteria bacterium RIFCSPHIGHO2_02_FULL_52_12]|uniref:Large ribosomal subunit protein bL27 n=1 Tax=Candidatus Azambacteria bacterium RIFCSPLOWO2_01_FULL_46_25 TaxID=1797298 RepID=A0A1F5BVU5_9BACT|nr:MAG: 50S ribosomal protein L27 [Candidatus Azambacteria bacterium RIFCSPHIGHO2_02_FULL_52_12]OGD34720.1 MAG: 50S ribosomal protein L27 [Candidatus Azambacteria bacterium RIFCSPLOWO2_01_FULL_46_25]OGD37007.1 MAG: 50S ribosomal protein L27 [Candidatus Azambacteria bacterium RIFCSPHIGHO2_01_FULL_51_74]